MCFNAKVSLFTFLLGTIFSILLINQKNTKYTLENKVTGIFLIFISLIQFMEFLFWIDIDNIYGINKVTTIIGPILNVCQPLILYLIKYVYYKPNIFSFENFNLPILVLNGLYFIYFIIKYIRFLSNNELVTSINKKSNNHLKWPWIQYYSSYFYLILFGINIFYLFKFNYASILFIITYFFLYLSHSYFGYNTGELWCFFGSFIPLIMYLILYYKLL
jgi:hypothetical protein